ncbi:MAG: hypothetical protein JST16_11420 [Bdellovibrionales bacterium]|nr:hypothetical protein [Bdellovibrionales bacterium]
MTKFILFMLGASLSTFAVAKSKVRAPAANSHLANLLECRSVSSIQLMEIQAEVRADKSLANFKVWYYGSGESSGGKDVKSVGFKEVSNVNAIFKNYADGVPSGYKVRGKAMSGKALRYVIEEGYLEFIVRPDFTESSGDEPKEARLIDTDRDSPVDFHSFDCWVSSGYAST